MQSHPGLCLILHDPPESLRRILALLWPGTNVELRVNGAPAASGGFTAHADRWPETPPNG